MAISANILPFQQTLCEHNLKLCRDKTTTLQINIGFLCNQLCQHCHLNAGPGRLKNMDQKTVCEVISYAKRSNFEVIDITGGAPELNPNIISLIQGLVPLAPKIMLRSNLSALNDGHHNDLMDMIKSYHIVIVASLPSLNQSQTDSQRGSGIFEKSIAALQKLNALGYGQEGSGLELNLVSNPTGAFLSPAQEHTEKMYRQVLAKKWGITFNRLFNFANVPIGRFHDWLINSGNFEQYMNKLVSNFNPSAVEGLMCRTLVSVSWDGYLYDCDFNLARDIFMGGRKIHVSEMDGPPLSGSPISVADHCYTCAAGSGFT